MGVMMGRYDGKLLAAGDGKLYFLPGNHGCILRIDPAAGASVLSTLIRRPWSEQISANFDGGGLMRTLSVDGKLYCVPEDASCMVRIDPATGTIEQIGDPRGGFQSRSNWGGMAAAADGTLYCAPLEAGRVLRISVEQPNSRPEPQPEEGGCESAVECRALYCCMLLAPRTRAALETASRSLRLLSGLTDRRTSGRVSYSSCSIHISGNILRRRHYTPGEGSFTSTTLLWSKGFGQCRLDGPLDGSMTITSLPREAAPVPLQSPAR